MYVINHVLLWINNITYKLVFIEIISNHIYAGLTRLILGIHKFTRIYYKYWRIIIFAIKIWHTTPVT